VATEQYLLTHLPEDQLAGMLQLIDGVGLFEFKDQSQATREEILANVAAISAEAAGGDRRAESAVGVVRLQPSRTRWRKPAVGRHGVPGPGPEPAFGFPQDTGSHHRFR